MDAGELGVEHPIPLVVGHVGNGGAGDCAGRVDEDVDLTETLDRRAREGRQRLAVGHVTGDRKRLAAAFADLVGSLDDALFGPTRRDDVRSLGDEGEGDGPADTAFPPTTAVDASALIGP